MSKKVATQRLPEVGETHWKEQCKSVGQLKLETGLTKGYSSFVVSLIQFIFTNNLKTHAM